MPASRAVTVGVPVYRGERFVEETLRSLQAQTHREMIVAISLDGPDPVAEALCRPFLDDPRFRLVVQPERLGWAGNISRLMASTETPYWCYQQQDDLLDPRYLEVLVDHAELTPNAAIVYCDIEAFGALSGTFTQPSVIGSGSGRQLALLYEGLAAVAFRGVTRLEALRNAGAIPSNEVDDFAAETVWMAAAARWGDLVRVPVTLYRKRYHDDSVHGAWPRWPLEKRLRGWVLHCLAMLSQALLPRSSAHERRLLWLAAVGRLVSPRTAASYLPVAELTPVQRAALLDTFLEHVRTTPALDVPGLLNAEWPEIERWTRGFFAP